MISYKRKVRPATAREIAGIEPEVFRDADLVEAEIRRRIKRKPIRMRGS